MDIHNILTMAWAYWNAHHNELYALIGGGAGLSVFLQWVLHKAQPWLKATKVDPKKIAYALIQLLSLAGAGADYILNLSGSNVSVLPVYAGLAIAAQTVHRFMVDPTYKKYVLPFLQWLTTQKTLKAAAEQMATYNKALPIEERFGPAVPLDPAKQLGSIPTGKTTDTTTPTSFE